MNAVAAGVGVGPVPGVVLDDPLFRDLLIPVLPDTPLQRATLYIVYMRRKFASPKVSAFIEFILDSLSHARSGSAGEHRQMASLRNIQSAARPPALHANS